ncbi:MAG: carboxypeptidase-like regulatory domain-containing protein, partial [Flavobacteriaceae bacterium]
MFKKISLFFLLLNVFIISAQNEVKGIVIDQSTNSPIIGATVVIKNLTRGTTTDFDGNFTLTNVPEGSTLIFSYLGFVTQELVLSSNEIISISLKPSISELSEVVLVGYGAQAKKEVTGAVSVIDEVKIQKLNPTRVEQAMQGQIPGVNVTSGSGSPGSGLNIRIRGVSTNGNNNPLILVDGNVIEDLSVINPNDIKSINILKDATAGIYGVRAANGVILIETKTGKKDTPLNFSFDAYYGLQQTSKKLDLLGPTEYAKMVNDASTAANRDPEFVLYPETGTDWQDEVFSIAPIVD